MDLISGFKKSFALPLINNFPFQRFIRGVEVLTIIFLASFFIYGSHFPSVIFLLLMLFLISAVVLSFIFLVTEHTIDLMGLACAILIFSGISIISLQIEGIIGRGRVYLANAAYIINSLFIIGLGIFLLKRKIGGLSKKGLFLSLWVFSLLLILYLPVSKLYFPRTGFGFGEISSGGIGGVISLIGYLSYHYQIFKEDNVEDFIIAGDTRRLLGDLKGAENKYMKGAEFDSKDEAILGRLGDLKFERCQFVEALKFYRQSLSWKDGRNYYRSSLVYQAIDEEVKAFESQKEALRKRSSASRWGWMGVLFKNRGDQKKANECFSKALAEDRGFYPAMFELGRLTDDEQEEEKLLLKGLEKSKDGHFRRKILKETGAGGVLPLYLYPDELDFWEKGQGEITREVAKELLDDVLRLLEIKDPKVWEWAKNKVDNIDDEDILEDLDEAISRGKETEKKLIAGLLHSVKGETKKAINGFSSVLEKDIDTRKESEVKYLMGVIWGAVGEKEKSLDVLEDIPDDELKRKARIARGGVLYLMDDLEKSKEMFKLSLFKDNSKREIWNSLKKIFNATEGDYEDIFYSMKSRPPPMSVYSYLKYPNSPLLIDVIESASYQRYEHAYEMLQKIGGKEEHVIEFVKGALQILKGDPIKAVETYKDLCERYPEKSECYFGLGRALLSLDKPKNALRRLNTALELKKDDPLYLFYRGQILFKTKRFEKAKDDFMKVQAKRPGWNKNYYYLARCERQIDKESEDV